MKAKEILNTLVPTTLITALGYLAGALAYGLRLQPGHDAEQYIAMLFQISHGSLHGISFIWPPGFPLMGLPFMWAGWQPDMALFTVQLLSFATLVVLLWYITAETRGWMVLRILILLVFALAPITHSVMYDFRSELPFAALLVILVWIPWPWNTPTRGLLAGLMVTALFLVRYAGISFVAFPLLAWFALRPRQPRTGTWTAVAAVSAAALIVLYTLAVLDTPVIGYATEDYNANLDVLTHASDLGLSLLGLIGLHAHLYLEGALRIITGLLLLLASAGVLAAGLYSRSNKIRLLSITAALYMVTIIGMRSLFWFDALSGARFAVPMLPALVAALSSVSHRMRLIASPLLLCTVLVLLVQLYQLFIR